MSGTLWAIPTAVAVAGVLLAVVMVELSTIVEAKALRAYPRIFGADAASSRSALATIAGAIITVAGVTFSITVVVVSQVSSQYTPRILRNFMRDRASQLSLGVLIAVFLYCLSVIRTIRGDGELQFVPSLAVLCGFLLAAAAIGVLVYFIHHVAASLEAGNIIARVTRETLEAIDRMFPEEVEPGRMASEARHMLHETASRAVRADRAGYLQDVDLDGLVAFASDNEASIRIEQAVGNFVAEDGLLLSVTGGPDDLEVQHLARHLSLDTYRSVRQDPRFGIRQLVDIALKALSPGINDATTAVTCLDYLQVILTRLSSRPLAGIRRRDAAGALRVTGPTPSLAEFVSDAFAEIRRSAAANPRVLGRMLDAIEAAGERATADGRRVLAAEVALIRETAEQHVRGRDDRDVVCRRCRVVQSGLDPG